MELSMSQRKAVTLKKAATDGLGWSPDEYEQWIDWSLADALLE